MDNKKLKEILLLILKEFDRICNSYSLQYFLVGGSAIGAIRHHGFIPWDDDIDVAMPRPDYEKLQKLPPDSFSTGFELISYKTKEDCYYDILKLEMANTTLITRVSPLLYIGGISLDIFPFDGTPDNEIEREKHFMEINKIITEYIEICFMSTIDCRSWRDALTLKIKQHSISYNSILTRLDLLSAKYDYDCSDIICSFHGVYGRKEYTRKEYFDDYALFPFETEVFRVPVKYHEFLSGIYGDYMTPPPAEKQKSHHDYLLIDFKRRLTKAELKEWIKEYKVRENIIKHITKFSPFLRKLLRLVRQSYPLQ